MGSDLPRPRKRTGAPRAVLSWSSGKDAAYALHRLQVDGGYDVVALVTTVVSPTGRVATHGTRGELLVRQAALTGVPLTRVVLPRSPSNVVYERAMASALRGFIDRGIRHMIFGDLFLDDIRRYRERQLADVGMQCVFPLWGLETQRLARDMIASGLEARLVAVDTRRLPSSWAGRRFDTRLLDELPPGVDPCGENGEFHTFVTAGPMLRHPIPVRAGAIHEQEGVATAELRYDPLPRPGRRIQREPRLHPGKRLSRGAFPRGGEGA
ncbi:MAG: ATP-binding protein [Thermoplasmata archaeon]